MRWKIIFTAATSLLLGSIMAQSLDESRALGVEAFARGDYGLSTSLLKRVLFFEKSEPSPELFFYLAEGQYRQAEYEEAVVFYDRAYYSSAGDSLKLEATFGKIKALLKQGRWDMSLAEIYSVSLQTSVADQRRLNYFEGLSYYAKSDFEQAELAFLSLASNQKDSLAVKALFDDRRKLQHPNPKTARILSHILPGAGQLYAGDVKNSLNSLLLNAALGGLFVYTAIEYTVLDATISVMPWFQRYYSGGTNKAAMIAEAKRAENRQEALRELIEIVE